MKEIGQGDTVASVVVCLTPRVLLRILDRGVP